MIMIVIMVVIMIKIEHVKEIAGMFTGTHGFSSIICTWARAAHRLEGSLVNPQAVV
jgi:hypothetical protein